MGGLVSLPWLAHRQDIWAVTRWVLLILRCFPITPAGKQEGQQSFPGCIKTQLVEQPSPAELSWRTGSLWINSFIRVSRRTVVSFLGPGEVQPLSSRQNKWVTRLPKSNKLTSLLSAWGEAWRRSCTISSSYSFCVLSTANHRAGDHIRSLQQSFCLILLKTNGIKPARPFMLYLSLY